ncbi:hypothetical protein KAS79_02165, partial [Candidatus Parcubacteria bacterium]|nr:hypothetical protein [Candidatus Parcubacteria bacterium]
MKKVLIIILIIFLSGIAGIASAAQYDWILGIPVQTDTTNYDWLKGAPYVITEAAGAAATTTVSGTVYTDEGSTGIGSDKTVRIKV